MKNKDVISVEKSRRDDMKPLPPAPLSAREGEKSRRDDTLLTGGFNRRIRQNTLPPKSRRDDTKSSQSAVPAGLW